MATVPVLLHLDHATRTEDILLALQCGVDSVMVDGSDRPFDENIRWTREMASLAHSFHGQVQQSSHYQGRRQTQTQRRMPVCVEGELGRLVGQEDGLSVSEKEGKLTCPLEAARFVLETGIDSLP